MEYQNERTLAYTLSTPISKDELERVSGGGGAQMTSKQTFKASSCSGQGADIAYDVHGDW